LSGACGGESEQTEGDENSGEKANNRQQGPYLLEQKDVCLFKRQTRCT
jgi:hypothetical protein